MHYFGLNLDFGLHFMAFEHKLINFGFRINSSFTSIRSIQ